MVYNFPTILYLNDKARICIISGAYTTNLYAMFSHLLIIIKFITKHIPREEIEIYCLAW